MDDLSAKKINAHPLPRWLITFADLMALLFGMFVMLLSFSTVNKEEFKKNAEGIGGVFNAKPAILLHETPLNVPLATEVITADEQKKLEEVYRREEETSKFIGGLKDIMSEEIKKDMVQLIVKDGAVIIRFPDKAAFPSGSMDLSNEILPAIGRIADTLARAKGNILVSGHTDDQPISTEQFRSNWDLSTERAVSVVHRLLQDNRIDPNRVTAQGFGASRPLGANNTPEGRSANRRVEITIEMDNDKGSEEGSKDDRKKWGG
ncbi:MAG: hypothetical protein A3G18_11665 [Rhodospirillales bacterium RIFCSPLOWO2_12_FULL_58_28]|nr:MAG: hypothetical protein A3H92_07295 [Rhodospirillales bacterium RIFCSPLOWO2_02_FULL_58_16]OHC79975.1 MAG: hypothetical protein A3G18_11665 [Rhodospirillales bacterium RIFCSPLOWO2_12_FULL_58_28]